MQPSGVNPDSASTSITLCHLVFLRIVLIILIVMSCSLVISTYSVFGHTWDEPEHLAAGLSLLDSGQYPYDIQHPPLARLAMAIGPYLAGARSYGRTGPSGEQEGRDILHKGGHYDNYLSLARAGILPFLIIMLLATWLWAQHTFGIGVATLATFFLATTPPVLGHAAVAALDIPVSAMIVLSLYFLLRWFDRATWQRAGIFGISAGLAVATKLSAIPFIGCTMLIWFLAARIKASSPPNFLLLLRHGGIALLLAMVTLIASYGWHWEAWSAQFSLPVPVGVHRLIESLLALNEHNDSGHLSYFMGEVSQDGWWNFYLVVLGVKTPLPMLLLGLLGAGLTVRYYLQERHWQIVAPVTALFAILIFSSAYSNINIGVRHVMVVYPLLAMLAAVTLLAALRRWQVQLSRAVVLVLLCWQAVILIRAYPDNLAYFNELAGNHPERIVVDSDLDWGQDVRRMSAELSRRRVDKVNVVYRGTADLTQEHFPEWHSLRPGERVAGWIAVSLYAKFCVENRENYAWLDQLQPVMRVGKTFDLYYVADKQNNSVW